DDPVRIWQPCSATGEEAYSVAILVREHLAERGLDAAVQIFATDVDEAAIAHARAGVYPLEIEAGVGEERLAAFFTRTDAGYRVTKPLREMIVFAPHNVVRDPPFSRLDLLVCRNFLIYVSSEEQSRLLSLFHDALRVGGFLFLGASETVSPRSELFAAVDKKWKIFRSRETGRRTWAGPQRSSRGPGLIEIGRGPRAVTPEPSPGELAEKALLERYAPAWVVVTDKCEVVHFSAHIGALVTFPVGEPSRDLLKMVPGELRPALRTAVHKALTEGNRVKFPGPKIALDGSLAQVNVAAEPLGPGSRPLALVVFEATPVPAPPVDGAEVALPSDESSKDALIRQLEEQLRVTHEELQVAIEQLATSNEGLTSTNEELISMNEEFQSANEELESSREELQTVNEELATINAELQRKVEALDEATSDMENLLRSSGIATLFLDRGLRVKRFTPAAADLFHLIPSDVGRPLEHLAGKIEYADLSRDARTVLDSESPVEEEIACRKGTRQYLMRVLPYRAGEGAVEGVVATFVDVTEHRRAEEEVRATALFPAENPAPVLRVARDGALLYANTSSAALLAEWGCALGGQVPDFVRRAVEAALVQSTPRELGTVWGERDLSFGLVPIAERDYVNLYGRDVTEAKRAREALEESERRYRELVQNANSAVIRWRADGTITFFNEYAQTFFGYSAEEAVGKNVSILVPDAESTGKDLSTLLQDIVAHPERHGNNINENICRDGRRVWMAWTNRPILDDACQVTEILAVGSDVTEQRRAEDALRENEERLRLFVEHAPASLAMFDREMRYLEASRRWLSDYGLGERDLQGLSHYEVFPEIPERWKEVHRRGLAGEVVRAEADRFDRADGTVQRLRWEVRPWRDAAGDLGGIVIFTEDVTAQTRAEEALRESEERFRTLFETMNEGFALHEILCDADGRPRDYRFLAVNPAFEAQTGLRAADLVGRTVREVLPGIESHWVERYGQVALTGEPADFESYSEGLGRWYEVHAYRTQPGRFAVVFLDRTERKRAEETLRRYELLAGQSRDIIFFFRRDDGRVLEANAAAVAAYGYTRAELLGLS
ncbi:MAG: PAS domain S-box protein, partial [Proteobacteria bacterium]|nr:PAS domain S-box protein [Pseudomonadota bacterium]